MYIYVKLFDLTKFIKGWFIGDFIPTILNTSNFEVAVKRYKKDDYEKAHYHKVATEITVMAVGEAKMNGKHYKENDIIIIEPGDSADFLCLTDVVTVVVKIPSAKNDKFES